MNKTSILPVIFLLSSITTFADVEHNGSKEEATVRSLRLQSLTDKLLGLEGGLADAGIELKLSFTQIYQQNARGGLSTHRRAGRFAGSYVLELLGDSQKLAGIEGGSLYIVGEGSWSKGIDEPSVGSFFGVNGDAAGYRTIDITEFWYEHALLDRTVRIRVGKTDLTGGYKELDNLILFDSSAYANDECTQFLNSALINNPSIPFPDNGLSMAVLYNPSSSWYVEAAIADAQADARETGFNTTFNGDDYFFYIFEAGITPLFSSANGPLQGAYRAGLWYDPQPKANSDYAAVGKSYRNDVGFYFSCDQLLFRENDKTEDEQGLGAFFRYGYTDSKRNDLTNFWSAGFQYQGLFENRDDDVLGLGFAQGIFSNRASSTYTDDYENAFELYYSAAITPWFNISPSIQYVANPGGNKDVSDAVVLGVRAQIKF